MRTTTQRSGNQKIENLSYASSGFLPKQREAQSFDRNVRKQSIHHNLGVRSDRAEKGIEFGELPTHNRGLEDRPFLQSSPLLFEATNHDWSFRRKWKELIHPDVTLCGSAIPPTRYDDRCASRPPANTYKTQRSARATAHMHRLSTKKWEERAAGVSTKTE
jgi:hypothetical protein